MTWPSDRQILGGTLWRSLFGQQGERGDLDPLNRNIPLTQGNYLRRIFFLDITTT